MCYSLVRQMSNCIADGGAEILEEQLIYLVGTMLVVDVIIFVAWAVPYFAGVKIGCRWRKLLWLMLAVCLLVPMRLVMSGIYEEKPSYFVQVDVPRIYGMEPNAEKADIRQVQSVKSPEVQWETGAADEYRTDDMDDTDGIGYLEDIEDNENIADKKIAQGVEDVFSDDLTEPSVLSGGLSESGQSMWVLSGKNTDADVTELAPASGESDQSPVQGGTDQDSDENIVSADAGQNTPQTDQDHADTVQPESIVFTEDLNDLYRAKNLDCTNCYTTEITRGGNHYWIDGQGTLWGTGPSEYGQLKEVREDLTWIKEPVEIAQNVKHVDFSGEYFVIFLTEDNRLYGLGGNPSGVLSMPTMEDYQFIITEPVLLMENVIYAKCGYYTVIALTQEGGIYMRGSMEYIPYYTGEQGMPVSLLKDIKYASWPVEVMGSAKYVASYNKTFAVIDDNDDLWTWGDNQFGQCGVGTFSEQVQSPQRVMDDVECVWVGQAAFNNTDETAVRARECLIVLKKDGTFYACGEGIGTKHLLGGINDLDEAREVTASEKLVPVSVQEKKVEEAK